MKNKKEHLKPAFILCGIVGVVIIIIFIASGQVNKNVANNLKGKALYTEGTDVIKEYDFKEDRAEVIGKGNNAHYADDGIVYNDTNRIYIYDGRTDRELYALEPECRITSLTAVGSVIAASYVQGDAYSIIKYDTEKKAAEVLITSDNEIMSVCAGKDSELYYTETDGEDTSLCKLSINGGSPEKLLKGNDERIEYITYVGGMILMCENKSGNTVMSRFNIKTSKAVELKFSSDEYNCVSAAAVYDEEYIVSSDKDTEKYALYVCNGSNMVRIDKISGADSLKVSDYIDEE